MKTIKGFTLAEILITLSILGVVAAITMSSIVPNYQERIRVTQLKKAYLDLQSSYLMAVTQYGPFTRWGVTGNSSVNKDEDGNPDSLSLSSSTDEVTNRILSKLDVNYNNSASAYAYSFLGGYSNKLSNFSPKWSSKNGMTFNWAWISSKNCNGESGTLKNICGDILVDLNGSKGPNVVGQDIFNFYITKDRIVPTGEKNQERRTLSNNFCNRNINKDFNGYACAAWVIEKGNMDYLRKDISW